MPFNSVLWALLKVLGPDNRNWAASNDLNRMLIFCNGLLPGPQALVRFGHVCSEHQVLLERKHYCGSAWMLGYCGHRMFLEHDQYCYDWARLLCSS